MHQIHQTETDKGHTLWAFKFCGFTQLTKAYAPHPLTTLFAKGNRLFHGSSTRCLDTQQIFRNRAWLFLQQSSFAEAKLDSLNDRLEQIRNALITRLGYFMKKYPLFLPTDKGPIQD
jgi:hypothetical protein